ncbi:MAG TPA: tetratricopeptide repeat protein [Chthoniobacterales bacterium]|nr:tetratricopeptide repeat protein [Chthoniobacterales bacterium]
MNRRGTDPPFWIRFATSAAIVALIWIVFGQTLWHDFVNYDDKVYVYGNALVSAGLSVHGIAHAFVDTYTKNWHPLTMISHMIDCQVFDLKPGGHHFSNVLFHSIAALALFGWLFGLTNRFWSAAFVSAIFAIHPLRVESVAWVAERKDVLSAVFFFLTLIAYTRYARSPSFGRYVTVAILFACGLMSKSMLVTTPIVLLLLDYWPLRRWQGAGSVEQDDSETQNRRAVISTSQPFNSSTSVVGLVVEKIPLFGLSLATSVVTFLIQIKSSESIAQLPFSWRLQNAIVTYVTYVWQLFWPAKLAVFYPHPDNRLAVWQVALAAVFLVAVTWTAFAVRKRHPYLIVGWIWYLVMLLPVIGIIEVGLQGHADRYTYLPHVGLYIAWIWLIADLSASFRARKQILGIAGVAVVTVLTACSWKQTSYWRNTESLWAHALAVTTDNDVALTDLGNFYMESGRLDEALSYLQRALAVRSASEQQHYTLSLAVIEATIGNVLGRIGRLDEALSHFRKAIELRPDFPDAHYNLGVALAQKGDLDGAIEQWRATLALRPNDPGTNTSLANVLVQKGFFREAVSHYEIALRSEPDSEMPLNNMAWVLSAAPDDSVRNGPRAVDVALRLSRVTQNKNPFYIRTLAAAYAEAGQFDKAIEAGATASGLADAQQQFQLAVKIEDETKLYRQHQPFRDPTLPNGQ